MWQYFINFILIPPNDKWDNDNTVIEYTYSSALKLILYLILLYATLRQYIIVRIYVLVY